MKQHFPGSRVFGCEPDHIIRRLQPGGSVAIQWPVEIPVEIPDYCMADAGTCFEFGPAPLFSPLRVF